MGSGLEDLNFDQLLHIFKSSRPDPFALPIADKDVTIRGGVVTGNDLGQERCLASLAWLITLSARNVGMLSIGTPALSSMYGYGVIRIWGQA